MLARRWIKKTGLRKSVANRDNQLQEFESTNSIYVVVGWSLEQTENLRVTSQEINSRSAQGK